MSFSNEWDERYQNNSHMSIWPWSDLVSLVILHINDANDYTSVTILKMFVLLRRANVPNLQKKRLHQ